jgi:hypothetical protein
LSPFSGDVLGYRSAVFSAFYGTFSTIAFTIFGLWMFVAQARFREWMENRDQYRRASAVSIMFALPGLMSLLALINSESRALWRIAFAVTSLVAVALLLGLQRRPQGTPTGINEVANWLAMLMFAAIAVVATWPSTVDGVGLEGQYRHVEFLFFCLLLLDGLFLSWIMLFAEVPPAGEKAASPG